VWITQEAVAAWQAPATGKRVGQPIYSAIAIETGLALRLVFHQPLRQRWGWRGKTGFSKEPERNERGLGRPPRKRVE